VSGILSEVAVSEVNEKFKNRTLTPADKPLYATARLRATVANVCFGSGALALLAAGVFYVMDPGPNPQAGELAFAPLLGPSAIGVSGRLP